MLFHLLNEVVLLHNMTKWLSCGTVGAWVFWSWFCKKRCFTPCFHAKSLTINLSTQAATKS